MKNYICLFFITLLLTPTISRAGEANLSDRTEWFVDAINGDDADGTGSTAKPFQTIEALLYVNDMLPESVGAGDTIFLAAGNYDAESVLIIDIAGLKIEGASDESGTLVSVLGDVKVTADGVTLSNCLFLDSELTLQDVKEVTIANNLFSGTTQNSLTLLGASNNTIRGNRFESARGSCVVLRCYPESKQSSSDNIFQANYFSHHLNKKTDQVILVNKSSKLKRLFGKKKIASVRNRFVNCVFEEVTSGHLKQVVAGHFDWRLVDDFGYSLLFEDCYFKKADRRVPFISFIIISGTSKLKWFWDDLVNDTWVSSNDGHGLTGHSKNEYTPSIRFVDADENGLILETEYPAGVGRFHEVISAVPSERENSAPVIVNALADIALQENPQPSVINLFDLFEDAETADEDLKFAVSYDNASIVSSELENGLLTLNYAKNAVGMAKITITATDDDSEESKSSTDSFLVVIVEEIDIPLSERSDWYIDSEEGNDVNGTGSRSNPFKTIERLFAFFVEQPDTKSAGSTVHLGKGNYQSNVLEINIPNLTIEGTLDSSGIPATIVGKTIISASGVKLKNCRFQNAGLTLLDVEDGLISNNVFSGETNICLSLLGSSRNTIEYNRFESAVHESIYLYWNSENGRTSNDNVFLRNYFTHRSQDVTRRMIRVKWSTGKNNSISSKNRFIECAFEETQKGYLQRVIADDCTWWMVAYHGYSTAFEDCYFKRADREEPFSEFEILKGHPDFTWRWDELINDIWFSTNNQWAITGDHNGWRHEPRVKFVDKNENGTVLEVTHNAGLSSVGSKR